MSLDIGKKYILTFDILGKILTFTGVILPEIEEGFITFIDKFNAILSYKKDALFGFREIDL